MNINIKKLDHLVLTISDINKTIDFYHNILGMELVHFGKDNERVALKFGQQKINLHESGKEIEPKAVHPKPGSADICLITSTPIANIIEYLHKNHIVIELGPVERTGALCPIYSIYCRDPDGNLIEIANEILR
jgi:catechol 2,3-dioxygenase-like lactoylglutathione lyase family enzyme